MKVKAATETAIRNNEIMFDGLRDYEGMYPENAIHTNTQTNLHTL